MFHVEVDIDIGVGTITARVKPPYVTATVATQVAKQLANKGFLAHVVQDRSATVLTTYRPQADPLGLTTK